jgi:polysaccharide deacetylase 2 family uncharacterized protein YibQ
MSICSTSHACHDWLRAIGLLAAAWGTAVIGGERSLPFTTNVAMAVAANAPAIAIIIDDMGNRAQRDRRAIHLPGAITYAFLPRTPHTPALARLTHELGKEVMLHLPMESMSRDKLGPGGLHLDMTCSEFARQLGADLAAVPHVAGVNNHMGSLLTQHPGHMLWLMQELNKHGGLYFVDSYTTKASVAHQIAGENRIPNLRRDVFLDSDRNPEQIRFHFRRLLRKARDNGIALAIGHPFPETLAVLEAELPKLQTQGIRLLPVSKLIKRQQHGDAITASRPLKRDRYSLRNAPCREP